MTETLQQEQTHDDVINAEIEQEHAESEEKNVDSEGATPEDANTGDKAVDDFLNGETEKLPEGTEEISEDEAKELEESAE